MESQLYRLDLKVGKKWIPATAEPLTEHRLEKLKRAYAIDRPHIETRIIPVSSSQRPRKKGRR